MKGEKTVEKTVEKKPNSSMRPDFFQAFKDTKSDWMTWIGQPMLYDGALYVKREGF